MSPPGGQTPDKPLSVADTDQTSVTVKVGPDAQIFLLHKDLLCHSSQYFRNLLDGSFEEAGKHTIELADVNTETFKLFMHWLYTWRLEYVVDSDAPRKDDTKNSNNEQHQNASRPRCNWETICASDAGWDDNGLLDIHIFADKYDVPQLRLASMRAFQRGYAEANKVPGNGIVIKAFENLPETSPLCRWLTDYNGYYHDLEIEDEGEIALRSKLPRAFLLGALVIKSKMYFENEHAEDDTQPDESWCKYHEHNSKEEERACDKEHKRDLLIRRTLSEYERGMEGPATKRRRI